MCTPYHTRRCVRRFWGFARRYVKSQKEPERNLANVVLLFVVHAVHLTTPETGDLEQRVSIGPRK